MGQLAVMGFLDEARAKPVVVRERAARLVPRRRRRHDATYFRGHSRLVGRPEFIDLMGNVVPPRDPNDDDDEDDDQDDEEQRDDPELPVVRARRIASRPRDGPSA